MEKISKRSHFTPPSSPIHLSSGNRDKFYRPDNRGLSKLLDTGEDNLPSTLELQRNPLYATALQDFATQIQSSQNNYGDMTIDDLFESVSNDRDLNNQFWRFIDSAKEYQSLSKSKK